MQLSDLSPADADKIESLIHETYKFLTEKITQEWGNAPSSATLTQQIHLHIVSELCTTSILCLAKDAKSALILGRALNHNIAKALVSDLAEMHERGMAPNETPYDAIKRLNAQLQN